MKKHGQSNSAPHRLVVPFARSNLLGHGHVVCERVECQVGHTAATNSNHALLLLHRHGPLGHALLAHVRGRCENFQQVPERNRNCHIHEPRWLVNTNKKILLLLFLHIFVYGIFNKDLYILDRIEYMAYTYFRFSYKPREQFCIVSM